MIQEDYCSYEVAKLLKEKGFKESTQFVWYEHFLSQNAVNNSEVGKPKRDYFYWEKEGERNSSWTNNSPVPFYISGEVYSCPTHQMAMKWLREKGVYFSLVPFIENVGWPKDTWHINFYNSNGIMGGGFPVKGYEEAVEVAIKYCLENLI